MVTCLLDSNFMLTVFNTFILLLNCSQHSQWSGVKYTHTPVTCRTTNTTNTQNLASEVVVHTHRCQIKKSGNTQPYIHILCNNLHCKFLVGRLLSTPTDSELRRQETSSHTHIYCCNSVRCRFLAGRLLSTPTDSELRRQETFSHTHIYCCNSVHCRFFAGRLLSM